jgi:hypothetical protein
LVALFYYPLNECAAPRNSISFAKEGSLIAGQCPHPAAVVVNTLLDSDPETEAIYM